MEKKRTVRVRICILAAVCILSAALTCLLKNSRGITGFFDFSQLDKLIVTGWDCLFSGLLIFGILCLSESFRKLFGIQFDLLKKEEKVYLLLSFTVYLFWALSFTGSAYGPDEYMRNDIPKYIYSYGSLPYGWEESIRNPIWGTSYGFNIQLPYLMSAYCMNIMSIFTDSPTMLLIASRMSSILSMVGVTFFALCITRKIYQNNPIRWVFIVLISLSPQVVFLASYENLDTFSLLTTMMILFAWIQCFERKWDIVSSVHLGISLALCLLSYEFSYGYIVLSFVLYCAWYFQKRREKSFSFFLSHGFLILGIVLLICGWKFIRNAILYNGDFLSLNASKPYAEQYAMEGYKPSEKSTLAGEGIGIIQMLQTMPWIWTTFRSSFGVFGYLNIFLEDWVYIVYEVLIIIGLLGFVISLFDRKKKSNTEWLIRVGLFFSGLFAILISVYFSWSSDYQAQGRYIIACLPCVFLGMTTGYEWIADHLSFGKLKDTCTVQTWISKGVSAYVLFTMILGYIACLKTFGFMS